MMPGIDGKSEPTENDPEKLSRLLELELIQKRAAWKNASARHNKLRTASFAFLFILILGSLFAFYLLFSRMNEQRANQRPAPTPSVSGP
jgi:hypothetical protein